MQPVPMITGAMIALLLAAGARAAEVPKSEPPPAGAYTLDKAHASIVFRVDHLGFSHFTGRMGLFDARLQFDPARPEKSRVEATVDAKSLASDNPPAKFMDQLHGPGWLDAGRYPVMTFRSGKITVTGKNRADIAGTFTMHGVTRPLVLHATFNGGYAGNPYDPSARIGFSAHGVIKRSQYGVSYGLPPPGTKFGVGDDVDVTIEAEFSGPAWKAKEKR